MAAIEITTLLATVTDAASNINRLGALWYQASTDFIDFQLQLGRLRRLKDLWFAESRKYGGLQDEALTDTLNDAASLLTGTASLLLSEERKLKSKEEAKGTICGCLNGCLPTLCFLVFPTEVKERIKLVVDKFDKISGFLNSEEDIRNALQKRMFNRTYTAFEFSSDDRYVSLEESESKVYSALMNPKAVVLLHGGPGQGKSTLARHVALGYNDQRKNAQGRTDSALFDRVVYLECGPEVQILPKQLELLRQLGLDTTVFEGPEQSTSDSKKSSNLLKRPEQSNSDSKKISNLLKGILKSQKILLILDDVWSAEFLQHMIDLCGSHIKCLVTSQRGDLCWRLNCSVTEISIQDIPRMIAGKILASHVGFPNQEIPEGGFKDEAERIIEEADGNPLALASVAAAIPRNRSFELKEWKNVSRRFLQLLKTEDTALIQSKRYPKSFWSAMKFSVESLTKEAQTLLTLMHLCEGASIPEEVIQYLHQSIEIEGSIVPFEALRTELESRELLKINSKIADPDNDEKDYSWSTHSLQKKFMEEEMRNQKKLLLDSLIELLNVEDSKGSMEREIARTSWACEEAKVRLAFCALYFQRQFAEKAAAKMGIPYEKFTDLRRNAIEPITRLLVQLESDIGKTTRKISAIQIFLGYICDGTLHHGGITDLLASQCSMLPMLQTLANIELVEKTDFVEISVEGWLENLIDLWSKDANPHLQKTAIDALRYLNLESISKLVNCHGALEYLSNALAEDKDSDVQTTALIGLYTLQNKGGVDSGKKLISFPGLLEKLSNLILTLSNSWAVVLLGQLVMGRLEETKCGNHTDAEDAKLKLEEYTKMKLENTNGLIQTLLGSLAERSSPEVQGSAAFALTMISPGRANKECLFSSSAYARRGYANLLLGLDREALADLDKAEKLEPGRIYILSHRRTVRARLGDYEGALHDADKILEAKPTEFDIQERGVLKRMMGDWPGALADLNEVLDSGGDDYESLKHRGYVRFLMKDEDGARSDAELASKVKPADVDFPWYPQQCLGTTSVEYLEYKLR